MKKILLAIIVGIFLISFISASSYPIHVKPINATTGYLMPNQTFSYTFNFTQNSNCSGVVVTNRSIITTISDGTGFIDIDLSGANNSISYLCEYRDGSLRAVHNATDQIFNDVHAQDGFFTQLGSLLNRISNLFVQDIDFSGYINGSGNINTTGNLNIWGNSSFNGTLMPMTTLTFDIGSGPLRWRNLFVTNISADYIDITEDFTALGNITGSYFFGDGAFLVNLNVSGNLTGVNFINYSGYTEHNVNLSDGTTYFNLTASTGLFDYVGINLNPGEFPNQRLSLRGNIEMNGGSIYNITNIISGTGSMQSLHLESQGVMGFILDPYNANSNQYFRWYVDGEAEGNKIMQLTEPGNLWVKHNVSIGGYLNVTGTAYIGGVNISTWALNVSLNYSEIVFATWDTRWDDGVPIWDATFNASFLNLDKQYSYNATYALYNQTFNQTYDNYALNVSRNWTEMTFDEWGENWYNHTSEVYETWGENWYNHTLATYNTWNPDWISTYNATYALYNQTFNQTYHDYATNVSLNYSEIVFATWDTRWDDGVPIWDATFNASFLNLDKQYSYNATYAAINTTANIQYLLNSTHMNFLSLNFTSAKANADMNMTNHNLTGIDCLIGSSGGKICFT